MPRYRCQKLNRSITLTEDGVTKDHVVFGIGAICEEHLKRSIPVLICPDLDINLIPKNLNNAFGIKLDCASTLWLFDMQERGDTHPVEFTPTGFWQHGYVLLGRSSVDEVFWLDMDESKRRDELEFIELMARHPEFCKKLDDFIEIKVVGR